MLLTLGTLGAQTPAGRTDAPATTTVPSVFSVKPLLYAEDALAPAISARTVALHYNKHLKGYANKLNELLQERQVQENDLARLVSYSSGAIFNNAGQLLNHTLYFDQFKPYKAGKVDEPQGALREAILQYYGSFEAFQQAFEKAGTEIFGSGWLFLATSAQGRLYIAKEQDAGSPVTRGLVPLIAIDVWEHAYYLDYENRRAEHLKQLWHILDWKRIGERYDARR